MKKKSKTSLIAGLSASVVCLACAELVRGPYGLLAGIAALGNIIALANNFSVLINIYC